MASVKENSKKEAPKNTGLKKCFTALVDRKQVNLDLDVLQLMIKHELFINIDSLDDNLSSILPLMLVIYIKNWPGWQRSKEYYSGKLIFKDWFEKFRQYIVVRLNYLIKNGYNIALNSIIEERKKDLKEVAVPSNHAERGAQTDYLAPKGFSSFSISINCPPRLLSSVIFTDSGDDILIKEQMEIPWTLSSIKELLNWPYVSVEFVSPELSFKRNNCGEYTRFINLLNSPFSFDKEDFIEQVEIIDPSNGRNCYTLRMLKSYTSEYISILRSVRDLLRADIEIIESIINEFLKDIEEIEMNETMATNTSVIFNIGKSSYIRNKAEKGNSHLNLSGTQQDIGYCEQYSPKMETSLTYFKGVQDTSTPNVSFSYLNIVKASLNINNNLSVLGPAMPVITYRCNFCNEAFTTGKDIIKHLKNLHKMEPQFMCMKCNKSFSISVLSRLRWRHYCAVIHSLSYITPRKS